MDMTRITRPIINFISDNQRGIISVGSAILVEIARRKCEPSTSMVDYIFNPPKTYSLTSIFLKPQNTVEQAIYSIMTQAQSDGWDSNKLAAAENIMSILQSHKDLEDGTYSFAIQCLNAISDTCSWGSSKRTINNYISRIGKGVK